MKYSSKVLIVDDNPAFARLLVESIVDNEDKFILDHILFAENADDAIKKYIEYKPILVMLDIKIPGKCGIDIAKEIRSYDEFSNIIFLSNYPRDPDAAELISKHLVMGTISKDVGTGFIASFLGFIIKIMMKAI
jgi:DNA-binding NarL/FixJ family response regulator